MESKQNKTKGNVTKKNTDENKKDREVWFHRLAYDVANLNVNRSEMECYALTANAMEDKTHKVDSDGVIRTKQYYVEKYFQFKRAADNLQIDLNRLMLERNITINELNEFINKNK